MINCEEIMVKIGDRIVGKKTGTLTPSTVAGIVSAHIYTGQNNGKGYTIWDELYPDWRDKQVIISQFDEPQKNLTMQELSNNLNSNEYSFLSMLKKEIEINKQIEDAILRVEYIGVPLTSTVAYPIDDVDII